MAITQTQAILGATLQSIGEKVTDRQLTDDKAIVQIGNSILKSSYMTDLFFSTLADRIGKVIIEGKGYTNQLSVFKKDNLPMGVAAENIYINFNNGTDYTPNSTLLSDDIPDDVKAVYFTVNSYKKYYTKFNRAAIKQAFTGANEMANFIDGLISRIRDNQQLYEWSKTKDLLGVDFNKNAFGENSDTFGMQPSCMRVQKLNYRDTTFANDVTKQIRSLCLSFINPTHKFNNYAGYVAATENILSIPEKDKLSHEPVITFSSFERMHLIMRNENIADIDVDTLSVSFNLSKVEFLGKVSGVPDFGTFESETGTAEGAFYYNESGEVVTATRTYTKVYDYKRGETTINVYDKTHFTQQEGGKTYEYKLIALVCDEAFIQIMDTDTPQIASFYDPSNMMESVYFHSWQVFSLSPLANAVGLYTRTLVE